MATAESEYPHANDEFETDVLPVRRRPRLPLLTTLLTLGAIVAAAFVGGVEIQKHFGTATAAASTTGAAGARAGAFARAGRSGFAGGGAAGATGGAGATGAAGGAGAAGGTGSFTSGLVTLIKGSTLYVTDFT